jgi:hypothetical protein
VALLYCAGELFACRRCYGLVYASQHEALRHRGLGQAQKIRMRLGGSANMLDAFPDKPTISLGGAPNALISLTTKAAESAWRSSKGRLTEGHASGPLLLGDAPHGGGGLIGRRNPTGSTTYPHRGPAQGTSGSPIATGRMKPTIEAAISSFFVCFQALRSAASEKPCRSSSILTAFSRRNG